MLLFNSVVYFIVDGYSTRLAEVPPGKARPEDNPRNINPNINPDPDPNPKLV